MNLHNTPRTIWSVWGMYKQDDLTRTAGTCNLNRIMQLSLVAWSDPKRHLYRNPKKTAFDLARTPCVHRIMLVSCNRADPSHLLSGDRRTRLLLYLMGLNQEKLIQDAFEWKLQHRHLWYPTEFGASRVSEYVVCHVPGMIGCDVAFWDW